MVLRTVRLRDVVERPDLGLTVLCGGDLLDRPVAWAHVSELPDPAPFLLGRELLLTAGVNFPADVRADVDRYVARLVEKDVSALGFGITPVHDDVPAALVTSCTSRGLPLVAVPPGTPFLAVSQAVGALIAEAQHAELRLLADSQQALTRAATRARPLEGTLHALASALDCWAVLLTLPPGGASTALPTSPLPSTPLPGGASTVLPARPPGDRGAVPATRPSSHASAAVVAGAGAPPEPTPDLISLAVKVAAGSGPRSAATGIGGDHVVLDPVGRSAVLAVGRPTPFSVAERAVVAVALGLLGLLHPAADRPGGRATRLATRLLLADDRATAAATAAADLADLLGAREGYRVVAGHGPDDPDRLTALLGTPMVDTADGGFRAVVPQHAAPTDAVLDTLRRHGWLVGVSSSCTAADLPHADREAAALLRRARAEGTSQRAGERNGVTALVDPERARGFAATLLAPLADSRTPAPRVLVETARAWLARHGSWDRSAAALGVHRNSVRHRIAHVERALGLDLSRAQHRADLWFALEWLPDEWPDRPEFH